MIERMRKVIRAGLVQRWHTEPVLEQNVGEHSWGVAVLILLMKPDASAELLRAAILHDLHESACADFPTQSKVRYPGLRAIEATASEAFWKEMGFAMPNLTAEEARLLKKADRLEALLSLEESIDLTRKLRIISEIKTALQEAEDHPQEAML